MGRVLTLLNATQLENDKIQFNPKFNTVFMTLKEMSH